MTHASARGLSRQELYSYGFKEGQPWGEDKRALESALNAMDKLERDIQDNYIYSRAAPSYNAYLPSAATPRCCMSRSTSGNSFSAGRYPTPDFRVARSDVSDYSPQMSEASPYSDRSYEYKDSHANYPTSRWQTQSARDHGCHSSSSTDFATSFSSRQNYVNEQQYYAPPSRITHSRSGSRVDHYPSDYYNDSRASSAVPTACGSANAPLQPYTSAQVQMVPYNAENGQVGSLQDNSDDQRIYASAEELARERNNWSMDATLGTGQVIYDSLSRGAYSEDSALSGYSEVTRSSGYVESYDAASYEGYREHQDQDSEDERDYMSDDVASNEGEYYSSGDEPEYDDDGDDVFSDEGSDSYDDGYDYSD